MNASVTILTSLIHVFVIWPVMVWLIRDAFKELRRQQAITRRMLER